MTSLLSAKSKIKLPEGSKFSPLRAMELANLIERAYQQYDFQENYPKEIWEPWRLKKLTGSTALTPNLSPNDNNILGEVEYELLAILQYTGYWFTISETVPFGFIVKRTIEDGSTGIFVVFRGTREEPEWYNNFRFKFNQKPFLNNFKLGQVSRGFDKIYTRPSINNKSLAIGEVVQKILNDSSKCPQDAQVFITGHSLGGALATLATLDIATNTKFKKPILYTFASPRVGNPKFAAHFASLECYRVANSEDIVTTLPPATGQLIGEEMLEDMTLQRRNTARSLRAIIERFTHNLSSQVYEHIGEPIYFTHQRKAISYNHNMFKTYREALPEVGDHENLLPVTLNNGISRQY